MLLPCYDCGTVFEGDRCPACAARVEGIKKAASLYTVGLCGGFVGLLLAFVKYPPIEARPLDYFLLPVLVMIPVGFVIVLALCGQIERRANLAALVFILAGAVLPSRAAFLFLNGALDKNPPAEVKTVVSNRFIDNGEGGPPYILVVSVSWNQKQLEEHLGVGHDTYSFAEIGDSLRLAIHPGAFSMPWYGQAVVSNGHREMRFEPR